jgi:hypothetical protein
MPTLDIGAAALGGFAVALIVILIGRLFRRKTSTVAALPDIPLIPAPGTVVPELVAQRAAILASLHAMAAGAEDRMRENGGDPSSCDQLLASLRRRKPWLSPQAAAQADALSSSPSASALSALRAQLESEFRFSSGLFSHAAKE